MDRRLLILLLAVAGCGGSDDSPCRSSCATGAIVGQVTLGGQSVSAYVQLQSSELLLEVQADTTGRFAFDVPVGEYRLLAQPADERSFYYSDVGPVTSTTRMNLVTLAEGVDTATVDMAIACLRANVLMHATYEDDDIQISAVSENGPVSRIGRVSEGQVAFDRAVEAGEYKLGVQLQGGEKVWWPGTHQVEAAQAVTIAVGDLVTLTFDLSAAPGIVAGSLTGAWRVIVAGQPGVELFAADSTRIARQYIDEDGAFAILLALPEEVRVRISMGGVVRWIGGHGLSTATAFVPESGGETRCIDLVDCGVSVGVAAMEFDGSPGADVTLRDAEGRIVGRSVSRVGPSVVVSFAGLDPGSYRVHIEPTAFLEASWLAQWHERAATLEEATPVIVAGPGEIAQVVLEPQTGGVMRGSVQGASWEQLGVGLTSAENDAWLGSVRGEVDGSFALLGVPDGDYRLGVWAWQGVTAPPAGVVWYPGVADWDSAAVISIRDHAVVTDLRVAVGGRRAER